MAGQPGLEPGTCGFGDRRSTIGATGLLGLLVIGVLAAAGAELGQDQLVGHGPLVLGRRVIPVPAHRTLERDDGAVHLLLLLFAAALEPTTRIELVTSSLPRKCSAD